MGAVSLGSEAPRVALPKIIAFWEKVSKWRPHISITIGVQLENSSDLSLGRRPESKSDEFLNCTPKVNKITPILSLIPLKKCYIVWEHDPAGDAVNGFPCVPGG